MRFSKLPDGKLPSVSLIICAYNEENVISTKIENSLELSYPKDKLEIIIVSDGSSDKTVLKAKEFVNFGIKVIEEKERKGKTNAQNLGVKNCSGEVVVFSDANTMLEKNSLRNIVECLVSSPQIGCASGLLIYKSAHNSYGEAKYQKFETTIKKLESLFCSLTGVNGAFYAIRKDDYVPLPPNIISDFVEPLEIYRTKGKISVLCEGAVAFEEEPYKDNTKGIIARKSRILLRGLYGIIYEKSLLNPLRYPKMSFELLSHKLVKWFSPVLLLLIYLSPLMYLNKIGLYLFAIFNLLLLFILLGYLLFKKTRRLQIFNYLFYFLIVNIADLLGWFYFLNRQQLSKWETKGR
jgi:cellulose synthase/poly-beta-1,6-N-acetylglucosamine synthase-like glycosyltransferase